MGNWILKCTSTLAVVGVLTVVAGISVREALNSVPVIESPKEELDTQPPITGDEPMLTATTHERKVHRANEANFAELVLNSNIPVLVDFYADWCGPCRMVAPVLEELAQETSDAKIVKVNVDDSPQFAAQYGINSIPSLKVFQDGQVVGEQVGFTNKAQLKAMLGI
jgi:thioredoxin 1